MWGKGRGLIPQARRRAATEGLQRNRITRSVIKPPCKMYERSRRTLRKMRARDGERRETESARTSAGQKVHPSASPQYRGLVQ